MRRAAAAAAAALLAAAGAAQAGAGEGRFAVRGVDVGGYPVVNLVVRGPAGAALPPVYEDGRRVTGLAAQNLGRTKAIVLAVDRSRSMAGAPLDRAAAAAESFLRRKPTSDLVSVVTFGATALAQAQLSHATIDADAALRKLSPDPVEGTALYDALVVSASELRGRSYPGRVIVVLTDGRDVRSLATLEDAVGAARRANAVVYAIALGDAYAPPLRRIARATGGSFYSSPTPAALGAVYRRIGAELAQTWRVSYTTRARPGDEIAVAVGDPHGGVRVEVPGARPPGPAGSRLLPRRLLHGFGGLGLVLLAVAVLLFSAALELQRLPRGARIKTLVRAHTDHRERARRERPKRPTLAARLAALDRRLRGVRQWKRVERLVETAGLPVSAATVVAAGAALGLLLAVAAAVSGVIAPLVLMLFALGAGLPYVAVRAAANRRIRAFEAQLPDVLTTIAGALRVGHGLRAAIQTVADEGVPPMSVEFRRVLAEERLGLPLEDALVAMCERLASDDLLYVATAVDVQAQAGGSVAGVFTTVAETVRQRQQHRRKVRAVTALGRTTAIVLSVMPFLFVGLVSLITPSYMLPFLRSDLGHALIAYSVVSIAVGYLVLNRLVNVKG
ncbi:MAG TPA: VWA domain-containing protein [Gaiellaceae bacterium]|nr:VWA domain-containing protein [Gaiellaceae bacterium]